MIKEEKDFVIENALYMVATPIGNLQDLTLRAFNVLKNVDFIACEDSREAGKLMKSLDLKKEFIICHAHNEQKKAIYIAELIQNGKSIAYISDAGTPCMSDPGNFVVREVQKLGFKIIPIPGASALTSILSVCSFNLAKGFYFAGFMPRTETKIIKLANKSLNEMEIPLIALESPYRIEKTLNILAKDFAEYNICLGRELTKFYEQIIYSNLLELSTNTNLIKKGEFILVINTLKGSLKD